ncbi:restriction endonuclease subunit S [Vibrio anguillarum]|uniref:Restriction endonuclease subunit S n=1 Tax=Vibrio anguillarum TaxID=55601 RepID=A0ABD4QR43_VIBAN|nr:restriction endonuclease subunit S [Vibrio anguillarum]MBT2917639.1 restriction endonuclease subunit S [Vibrio anguillarum]
MSAEQTSMNQLITDNIDIWTSTVKTKSASGRGSSKKRELYGVKKLRELILELAVRGKLVPQDPTDEPASVLLERIAEEKAQLVKDKKIKKQKLFGEVRDEEALFELPLGWQWTRLSELSEIGPRNSDVEDESEASFVPMPMISTSYKGDHGSEVRSWKDIKKGYTHFRDGDIALAKITPCFENSKAAVFSDLKNGVGTGTTELHVARPILGALEPLFVLLYLKAPMFLKVGETQMTGSAGQKRVPKDFFAGNPLPYPPLKEQHRIVAKVDELMTLCDQLEQQTEASIEAHQVLVETLLATLTNSQDATELMANWARISEHFETLFTTEQSIDQLKQTILQLAVMGKLVPQDPNDEPAAKLLERIAIEKAQLVNEKKIKKQKALPPIANSEKPFELPEGWVWCRLDDICQGITSGSTPPKSNFQELPGIPYLKVYNIRNQLIDFEYNPQFIDIECHSSKLARSILYPGDVVMNIVGPPLGKIALIPDSYPEWNCNQAITFFRPIEPSLNRYIYTYLTTGTFLESIELIGTAGQDNISVTKSRSIVLPTPPLEEQSRIVRKVNDLLEICEQLKQRLRDSQQTQLQLTDAIVEQAL